METINRIKSFAWRYGLFVLTSIGAYLGNVADIQDISPKKLLTWFAIITASFIGNEITKYLNSEKKPLEVAIVEKPVDTTDNSL